MNTTHEVRIDSYVLTNCRVFIIDTKNYVIFTLILNVRTREFLYLGTVNTLFFCWANITERETMGLTRTAVFVRQGKYERKATESTHPKKTLYH